MARAAHGVVDEYHLIAQIGAGGMAEVYLARSQGALVGTLGVVLVCVVVVTTVVLVVVVAVVLVVLGFGCGWHWLSASWLTVVAPCPRFRTSWELVLGERFCREASSAVTGSIMRRGSDSFRRGSPVIAPRRT